MIIGEGTQIYQPSTILDGDGHDVRIGNNCAIGQFSFIAARKFIMENNSEIGPSVVIGGGGDVTLMETSTVTYGAKIIPATFATKGTYMNDRIESQGTNMIRGSVVIGKGAYIGSGAIICISEKNPHIKIGDFAVIGALTYIDKDVQPNTVIHNCQKLELRKRSENNEI